MDAVITDLRKDRFVELYGLAMLPLIKGYVHLLMLDQLPVLPYFFKDLLVLRYQLSLFVVARPDEEPRPVARQPEVPCAERGLDFDQLTFAVLTILLEPSSILRTIHRREGPFPVHNVLSPIAFVPISFAHEEFPLPMPFAGPPISNV